MKTRKGSWAAAGLLAAGLSVAGAAQATLIDRGGGLIYDDVLDLTWLGNANYAATELTDARRDAIISAVNTAAPSWLGTHTMSTSDFAKSGATYTGQMTWFGAMAWADQLVYAALDDWRLPVMVFPGDGAYVSSNNGTTTGGFGATGSGWGPAGDGDGLWSELGWMWYHNLDNLGYCTPNGGGSSTSCNEQSGWGLVDDAANLKDETLFGGTIRSSVYWSGTEFAPAGGSAWHFLTDVGSQIYGAKYDLTYTYYAWAVRPGDVAAAPEPGSLFLLTAGLAGLGVARRKRPSA